ncbi:MAG: gamma-glutamyl-gamma-aminobutyrate hydrolase family protein [Candidatus Brocadiaceae bacterium]|nr:gamma-glutamyl-gamma-aminobutyrate hydrolase family protein [Candidatus Brocadiaceae bacterium]
MKPIIGINCDYDEKGKMPYSFLYRNYYEAIKSAGGIPVLLPIINNKGDAALLLKNIGGLLLTGGDDIPSHHYGAETHETSVPVHPDKYFSDSTILMTAIRHKKPILSICYGTQLVNVCLGGSLIQDIPSEISGASIHKDAQNEQHSHPITIEKNSLLYKIVGKDCVRVNSTHHQAIKDLGKGLKATAHSADGVIEAIELEGDPFLLGVQWHPEGMRKDPSQKALFETLTRTSR